VSSTAASAVASLILTTSKVGLDKVARGRGPLASS
jgi:hypothetical protein